MYKKILSIFLLVLLISVGIIAGNLLYRNYLTDAVKSSLHDFVRDIDMELILGSAELQFPGRMVLNNVLLTGRNMSLKSERMYVYLSPINIINMLKGKVLGSITNLHLDNPELYLTDKDVLVEDLKLNKKLLVSVDKFSVRWKNGNIYLPYYNLKETYGAILLKKDVCLLELKKGNILTRGIVSSQGNISKISGNVLYNFDDKRIQGKIKLNEFDMANLNLKFAQPAVSIQQREVPLLGMGDFVLNLTGTVSEPLFTFNYSLREVPWNDMKLYTQGEGKFSRKCIKLKGKVLLTDYHRTGTYDVNINNLYGKANIGINFPRIEISVLNKLFGTSLPIDGKISYSFNVTGKIDRPELRLRARGSSIHYKGEVLPKVWSRAELDTQLLFERDKIAYKINKLVIKSDNDELISFVSNNWKEVKKIPKDDSYEGEFDISVRMQNYQYRKNRLFGKTNLVGNYTKKKSAVTFDAIVGLNNVWLNQHMFQSTKFKINYKSDRSKKVVVLGSCPGEECTLSGIIDLSAPEVVNFDNVSIEYKNTFFKIKGSSKKDMYDISLQGENINSETITEILNLKFPLNGPSNFIFMLKNSINEPYITGTLNITSGEIYDLPFSNINLQCIYENNFLTLPRVKLIQIEDKKEQYVITGKGKIPIRKFTKDTPISLFLTLQKGDLSILENFFDDIKYAKGDLNAEIEISGTVSKPVYRGFVIVKNGNIYGKRYFDRLSNLNANLEFKDDKFNIKRFSCNIGGGEVRIGGYISLARLDSLLHTDLTGLRLFNVDEYNIAFNTIGKKGIRINVPELPIPISPLLKGQDAQNYSFGRPFFSLKMTGEKNNSKLTGYVRFDSTRFSYPPPEEMKRSEFINRILGNTELDVEIEVGKNTWYENELMSLNIDGGIKITGKVSDLIVNGRIESIRGNINYIGKMYDIKEAVFEIINNECFFQATAETTAIFAVEARADRKKRTLEMVIPRAPIGEVKPKFMSREEFGLSSQELERAAFGFSKDLTPEEQKIYLRRQLIRLIDSTLLSPVARNLLQRRGLIDFIVPGYTDTTEYDLSSGTQETYSLTDIVNGMEYTLGKYLSPNVILSYIITLNKATLNTPETVNRFDLRQEIELSYLLKRNVMIRIVNELPGKDPSRDPDRRIMIEPYWRFGWETEKGEKL